MAIGRIRVLRAIPGSTGIGSILRKFSKKPDGLVTAFSDSLLPMCRSVLGEDASQEVVSFPDLVKNFLVLCGEDVAPLAQSGHKQAAIAHAASLVEPGSPFHLCARFSGLHEALGRTLDELHLWGIDAEAMRELASRCNPRLASKLTDLAMIDQEVTDVLGRLGRQQHTHQIRACLESTLELEGDLSRILVFVGSDECPIRIQWLQWAAGQGIDVTVVLDRHATDAPIFLGAENMIRQLGADAELIGPMNQLLRNLFAQDFETDEKVKVSKVSAADSLAEVEWAIRGCIAKDRMDRSGIYVRDLESYAPLIESVAKRLDVPIRMARRAALLTNSFARLTLAALKFCASNDVRTLSPVLRSSYLRLSGKSQNELEAELRVCYSQKNAQWPTLEAWAAEHAETHEWLIALLEWRRKADDSGLRLPEWYALLQEFNRDQRLPWARLENKGGAMDERDRRSLNQMERLLANHISVDSVTSESKMPLSGFAGLCEKIWIDGDVSIPTGDQGVRVSSDPTAFGDIDVLHVLGMLEGVFPRRSSEDPILTDSERHEISAFRDGMPALGDSHSKAHAERDEFYRVCAAGQRELVFSYPLADDQRDNIPAFYLTEVERAVGGENQIYKHDYPRQVLAPELDACLSEADRKLRVAMDGPRELPLALEILTEGARSAIRPVEGAGFRPNVLRDALQCPFQYLVRHVLSVRVKRQSERWGSLRKLPQVAQLMAKKDMVEAERALQVALEAELDRLYSDVPDWEMQLLRAGGERLIRDWLVRETRSREEWKKEEGSVKTNVSFGSHGVKDLMPTGVRLEGAIAGISRLEGYNVAHLYGSAVGNPKELTDVEKLYFGLHLLAIHEPGREGAIEVESMTGKRTLMVLGRGGSQPLASSVADGLQVVDLAVSDDLNSSKKSFYSDVKKALASAVQRILEGRVDATKGEHCDWCDYGELCRRSRGFGEDDSPFGIDQEFDDV